MELLPNPLSILRWTGACTIQNKIEEDTSVQCNREHYGAVLLSEYKFKGCHVFRDAGIPWSVADNSSLQC